MIMAGSNCEVPKFTVICLGSFGAGNYGMSGRAFDSRFLFAWPQSQISVMGAEQAANTLADVKVRQLAKQRSEEHTSELQSLMRISYAVFCLKKKSADLKNTHLTIVDALWRQ